MWLSNRRWVLLAPLALVACGFTPVYGPNGATTAIHNRILVDEPQTRSAYLLTQRIEERLGRTSTPDFGLSLVLNVTEDGLAINTDGDTERYNVIGKATYVLRDLASDSEILRGETSNFTGYSATGSTVTTLAAQRDAHARLMTILADQIILRLQSDPALAR